jgi:hypothetical protein
MKRFFFWLHTYGGFLFFPLLIVFGLSALNINHKFSIMQPRQDWTDSQTQINITNLTDNQLLAEALRDSLSLMGWCPYWTQDRNEERFKFSVVHNGAEYRVEATLKTGIINIKRRANGFGSILNSLHFLNEDLPRGSWIINSWQYFKDFCVFYIIVAIFSGLYFFVKRKTGLVPCIICLGTTLIITTILIICVWQIG